MNTLPKKSAESSDDSLVDLLSEDFETTISFDQANFDEKNMVIRGASLTYFKSKNRNAKQEYNGREYDPEAMKDLRELSDGVPIFNDKHIKTASDRHANLTEIGHVRNVTGNDKRNRGDLDLFETDQARTFFYASREKNEAYGLSHEAMKCRATRPKRGGPLKVHSVTEVPGYIVTRAPGTNTNLFEDVEQDDDMTIKDLTAKKLKDDYPEVYEELLTELHAESGAFIEGEAGGNMDVRRMIVSEDRQAIKKLLLAEATIERLQQELQDQKDIERLRIEEAEIAQKVADTTGKLVELALAEERDLSDKMKDMFLDLNKEALQDLTESDMLEFVQELPVLVDSETTETPAKKKVASRSGSDKPAAEEEVIAKPRSGYLGGLHSRLARRSSN